MRKRTKYIIISWVCWIGAAIIISLLLTGCRNQLSADQHWQLKDRMNTMHNLSQMIRESPVLLYHYDPGWSLAGQVDCDNWRITLNYWHTVNNFEFVERYVIPHEYAHLMSCHYRGTLGADPHDRWWSEAVTRLGGDPNYI